MVTSPPYPTVRSCLVPGSGTVQRESLHAPSDPSSRQLPLRSHPTPVIVPPMDAGDGVTLPSPSSITT
jgi:hypothetical protein